MSNKRIIIKDIIDKYNLKAVTCSELADREIKGGYASDLLSDVMANSKAGDIWVTLQKHPNIVAVAKLKELSGIIIVNNRMPDDETLDKAKKEAWQRHWDGRRGWPPEVLMTEDPATRRTWFEQLRAGQEAWLAAWEAWVRDRP